MWSAIQWMKSIIDQVHSLNLDIIYYLNRSNPNDNSNTQYIIRSAHTSLLPSLFLDFSLIQIIVLER